ncbi:tRNA pseudouridine(54/55) synthase Pus10 [Halorutilales archaeon Cl-col2-1]
MNDVLEEARCVLDEGDVCDYCLGRRFATLSYGLSNRERGKAVRTAVALEDDDEFEDAASDDCWVCDGAFTRLDDWAERVVESLEGYDFDNFLVGTRTPPLVEENESLLDSICGDDNAKSFRHDYNREVGKRVGEKVGKDVEFERPDVVGILNLQEDEVEVQINPVFIYGRYRKLERGIPQTEWPCRDCGGRGCERCDGTGYMYDESVEEIIRPHVIEATEGDEMVFHGAGREDVDAKMLGSGRPFVAEVKEPRVRRPGLDEIRQKVNGTGKVEVEDLHFVTRDTVERVKSLDSSKRYRAKVVFSEEVSDDELDDALSEIEGEIEQRTPDRVSHRRADKVRRREVYDAEGETEDETTATVEVHGTGGLYIKELISGDGGRTNPSLSGLLGVDAEVESLDVVDVIGDYLKDDYIKE